MRIYVGNLSYEVGEADLREEFQAYGEVESVTIIKDRGTERPKGFGFVEMASEEEAQEAIRKLNGEELSGRKIIVQEARPRKESPRTSFGRSGFRRGGRY